jgi:hypothetical protein
MATEAVPPRVALEERQPLETSTQAATEPGTELPAVGSLTPPQAATEPGTELPVIGSLTPPQAAASSSDEAESTIRKNTTVTIRERHSVWTLLKQLWWSWTVAILTLLVYCFTVAYAFGAAGFRRIPFIAENPAHTLTALRVLSEVTGVLLTALINSSLERLLWMLCTRAPGVSLPGFLVLEPGTGAGGWLQMILGNAKGARVWSLLRIMLIAVVPVMGVILLSFVDIGDFFDSYPPFNVSAGVGKFDVSYLGDTGASTIVPVYLLRDFSGLLQNNVASFPSAVVHQISSCNTTEVFASNACGAGYFLHGGLGLVTPWPTKNQDHPSASVYTLNSVRGLQLDFTNIAPGARFDGVTECIVVGSNDQAIQICISQYDTYIIDAKFVHCPLSLLGNCLLDTSWHSSSGWAFTLSIYSRTATAHFSRFNLSTIAISDLSPPIPEPVKASDLLSVYNTSLQITSSGFANSGPTQLIYYVSANLTLAETLSETAFQPDLNLRNFLTAPLLYFSPNYMSPYTTVPSPNKILDGLPNDQGLYITASLSIPSYRLIPALWSAWVYTILMGAVIIACVALLVLGSLPVTAGQIPETTFWPFVDFVAECEVRHGGEDVELSDLRRRAVQNAGDGSDAGARPGNSAGNDDDNDGDNDDFEVRNQRIPFVGRSMQTAFRDVKSVSGWKARGKKMARYRVGFRTAE